MRTPTALAYAVVLVVACGKGEQAPPQADLSLVPPADTGAPVASPEELRPPAIPPASAPAPATPRPGPRSPAPAPAPPEPAVPPPASAPAPPPPPAGAPTPLLAAAGTQVAMVSTAEISSRRHRAGDTFTARVTEPVWSQTDAEVIPAGALMTVTIVEIAPAEHRDAPGTLVIRPTSVAVGEQHYQVRGDVIELQHTLQGRGVTAGDAGKVVGGAAAGAVVGRILGRRTSGAVVGGAVGAAAGTMIAIHTADRDVVVPEGTRIVVRLTEDLRR